MTQNTKKTLGYKGARLLTTLSAQGNNVFTFEEAQQVLGENAKNVAQLLYTLAQKRWVERLEKGKYMILPFEAGMEGEYTAHEFLIAAKLIHPYYIAYRTALRHYGYTERVSSTVYVATTKRKEPVHINGVEYRFVTLVERKFFGIEQVPLLGQRVAISSREKTVVDCLDHPEYAGGVIEAAKGLWFGAQEIDLEKLVDCGERMGSKAVMQRLGFWLERLGMGSEDMLRRVEARRSGSYVRLDTMGEKAGPRDSRWRLIVNIPERQLLEWREH